MISAKLVRRLSLDDLKHAIALKSQFGRVARLERQRDQHIKAARRLEGEIERLSSGSSVVPRGPGRKRRRMSAETRRKMAQAAKARWAKVKQGNSSKTAASK